MRWISVNDRLPELHPHEDAEDVYVSDRVLLYIPGRYEEIVIGEYEKDTCNAGSREGFVAEQEWEDGVTHWMPLPREPKLKGKAKADRQNRLVAFWNDYVKESDLTKLDERQRRIAFKRFGEGKTLKQISQEELVTYQRIMQIVYKILRRLNLYQEAKERKVIG